MSSFDLAVQAFKKKDFKQALNYLEQLNEKDNQYNNALGLAINISEQIADKELLIHYLSKFCNANPDHYESRVYLANELVDRDAFESFKYFNEALGLYWKLKPELQNKAIFEHVGSIPKVSLQFIQSKLRALVKDETNDEDKKRFLTFVDCLFTPENANKHRHCDNQQPSYLFYPELTQKPWYTATEARLPESIDIEEIQKETIKLLESKTQKPYFSSEKKINHELESVRNNENWSAIKIMDQSGWVVDLEAYPRLKGYINKLPLANCPPHAPEVILSILKPGTHIPPHFGISNFKLATHLPIIVPEGDLSITVGNEKNTWTEGQPIVFDDSFLHEAINNSSLTRVVLIADVWHPALSDKERGWIAETITLLDEWHKLPANRIFHYAMSY